MTAKTLLYLGVGYLLYRYLSNPDTVSGNYSIPAGPPAPAGYGGSPLITLGPVMYNGSQVQAPIDPAAQIQQNVLNQMY